MCQLFLTLSCADLRWDELIEIIQKLSKADKVDVDMSGLSNHEKCSAFQLNFVSWFAKFCKLIARKTVCDF